MKIFTKALAYLPLLCFFSGSSFAQQFSWLYPKPTGNDRYSIFKAGGTIYTGGYAGSVVKTSNEGSNWSVLNTGLVFGNGAIEQVKFVDANTGFIGGQMYSVTGLTLRKTTNGGQSWAPVIVAAGGTSATIDMQFLSGTTGYVSGNNRVYKTTDGGSTWTTAFDYTAQSVYASKFSFINDQEGWLIGRTSSWPTTYKVYHTTDGGAAWTLIYTAAANVSLTAIYFDNATTGFVATNNTSSWPGTVGMLKMAADGSTATETYSGALNNITRIQFAGNSGYALSLSKGLIKTTDAGDSWNLVSNPDLVESMRDVFVEDANTLYVAGGAGIVQKTTDGGSTWTTITGNYSITPGQMFAISSADKNTIYASEQLSFPGNTYKTNVYKSTNGGTGWTKLPNTVNALLSTLDFGDNSTGFMAGQASALYKTADGGATWSSSANGIAASSSLSLNSVEAVSGTTAFVGGGNDTYNETNFGVLYKTTDGGDNWNQAYYNTSDYIVSVRFYNNLTGFATGYRKGATYATDYKVQRLVLKTTDGGATWTAVTMGTPGDSYFTKINNLSFVDQNTVYATGGVRYIYKSTDGGDTWSEIDLTNYVSNATYMSLNSVYFTDANNGYIFTDQGSNLVLKTTNGGSSWSSIDIGNWQIGNVNKAVFPLATDKFITAGTNSSLVLFSTGTVTLPVTMQSFTGHLVNNNAMLQWRVTEEANVKQYGVEQSFNNGSFETVGTLSAGRSAYSFEQSLTNPGTYSFRIRSADVDGRTQVSKTVNLTYKNTVAGTCKIINPVKDQLVIEQSAARSVEVRVMDMGGHLLSRTTSSNKVISLDVSTLPHSTYTVQIIGKEGAFASKFVKN